MTSLWKYFIALCALAWYHSTLSKSISLETNILNINKKSKSRINLEKKYFMLKTTWLTYVNHHECVWYGPSVTPRYEQRLPSHLFWSASEHCKISSVYFFSNEPKLILWISFLKIYILLPIFQIFGQIFKQIWMFNQTIMNHNTKILAVYRSEFLLWKISIYFLLNLTLKDFYGEPHAWPMRVESQPRRRASWNFIG